MLERKVEDSLINILRNVSYDPRQNMVTDCPPPSLEYLSLFKIAICLWKVHLEKKWICEFYYCSSEKKILNIVPNLLIPNTCKEDLKQIIKSVGREMSNNFLVWKLTNLKKLKVNLNNICWNPQGAIHPLKTATKIIEDTNLSTLEKFELACHFCLKDKIRELQKRLSKTDIKKMKTFSLMTFWSLFIKNNETLPTLIKGIPALDFLQSCLKKTFQSDVAIQYLWETFADETWKERITLFVLEVRSFGNIKLYFLQQMTRSQLEQLNYTIYQTLLLELYSISKCNNFISLSRYACEIIKTENCVNSAFTMVQFCWRRILSNLGDCVNVWNAFAFQFKDDLKHRAVVIYEKSLRFVGNAYKQGLFVKLLLDFASSEDRKTLIHSKKTIMFCHHLLCEDEEYEELLFKGFPNKDGLESFDIFINLIMGKNENEISQFKKKYFEVEKMTIFIKLIIHENYKLLDKLLNKFYTEDTLSEFKKKYCIKILDLLSKEAKRKARSLCVETKRKKVKVSVVNHFLRWCLEDDKHELARYKAFVVNLESNLLINKICSIILWGKWILVRKYWKSILCTKRNNTNSNEKSLSYMRKKNCPGLLKRLITSCFDKDEVKELQEQLRHNDELLLQVKELIELKDLPEVDGLLSWCFSSDENKICDFKTKFMKAFGCPLLFQFIEFDDIEEVKAILSWFNPSVKSAKMFKERFTIFITNKKKIKLNNSGRDGRVTKTKKVKTKNMLNKSIQKSIELLNSYIKENCDLDKENDAAIEHSKKRKIAERKEPIRRSKRNKISN